MVRGGVMDISRRGFLALAGPGLFVFFGVERLSAYQQEPGRLPGRQAGPADFNAYLRIGADGRKLSRTGTQAEAVGGDGGRKR